jgi:hypothetical protein
LNINDWRDRLIEQFILFTLVRNTWFRFEDNEDETVYRNRSAIPAFSGIMGNAFPVMAAANGLPLTVIFNCSEGFSPKEPKKSSR